MRKTLTNHFLFVVSMATVFLGCGTLSSVIAGPEALPDRSKDKVQMIEAPPPCDPRWYFSIGGNAEFNFGSGDFVNGESETFDAGGALFDVEIDSADYSDVYDQPFYSVEAEFGYVLTRHIEVFGQFKYSASIGTDRTEGSSVFFDIPGIGTGDIPIHSRFEDFESYGGQLGIRYFFLSKEAKLRPYVSLAAGATYVPSINVHTTADTTILGGPSDFEVFSGRFYDDSWVFTGTALLGLEYSFTCHFALGINGGVSYQTELDDDDSDLEEAIVAGNPFGIDASFVTHLNNGGDRWYAPVSVYAKFRF